MLIDNKAPLALPCVTFVEDARYAAGLRREEIDVGPAETIARLLQGVVIDDFSSSDVKVVSGAGGKVGIEMKIWTRNRSRSGTEGQNLLPRRRNLRARKWRQRTVVVKVGGDRCSEAERDWARCGCRQSSKLPSALDAALLPTLASLTRGFDGDRRRRWSAFPEVSIVGAPPCVRIRGSERVLQRFCLDGPAGCEEGGRKFRRAGGHRFSNGVHRSPSLKSAACVCASAKDVDAEVDVLCAPGRDLSEEFERRSEMFLAPPIVAEDTVARLKEGQVEVVQAVLPSELP